MFRRKFVSLSRFPLLFLSIALLALARMPSSVLAQTKTFHWTQWDIDIVLQPDGSLNVTETQTLNFIGEPFTFGFRGIPVGSLGNNDGITNVSVSENGIPFVESFSNQPGSFEVINDGGETLINWYFEPALGAHTYVFNYTVHGAVRVGTAEQGDGDQIFWTVLPIDHPARVDRSITTITLPEGVFPQKFTGTENHLVEAYLSGAPTDDVAITVSEDERVITFETLRPIMSGEKLDVRVQFPHGLLATPTPEWQAQEQRSDAIGLGVLAVSLLLLIAGPLGVVLLWYLRGRDPELGIVVPDYITEPPDDMPPAMVGGLIDEKVDMQDIMSTLVHLAHRGYVEMEEGKRNSYTFIRTDKDDHDLRNFERTFLKGVFQGENSRTLNSLRYKFANKLPTLRSQIIDELIRDGYLPGSPQSVRTGYMLLAGAVLVLGFASLFFMGMFLGNNAFFACFPALAIIATAIALLIAARHMPRKTAKGTEVAAKWEAFKTYLKNIKEYTDIESSGDIFEKYLPYAIAFGLERSFINTFSQSPSTPIPGWYSPVFIPSQGGMGTGPVMAGGIPRPVGTGSAGGSGGGMPNLGDISGGLTGGLAGMSAGLTRMLNNTSNVLKSTPPPANTGGTRTGSFGGGFSGGSSGGFSGGSSGGGGRAGFG